jgi:Flp pilus assembly protein TadG
MNLRKKTCLEWIGAGRRIWENRSANAAVEFALVAPVLVYVMLSASDLALASWQKGQVGNAARAGAQYAAVNGWNNTGVTAAAQSATSLTVSVAASSYCGCAGATGVTQQTCGTTCSAGGSAATYVTVTASANYTPISPHLWGLSSKNLNVTSVTRTN